MKMACLQPFIFHLRIIIGCISPADGKLISSRYIPGELFSVNQQTAATVPNLFARNERLVCEFESEKLGRFCVILVGAMLVAGIETVWGGMENPGPGAVRETDYSEQNLSFAKGDEIGRFKFGSTVILLFKPDAVSLDSHIILRHLTQCRWAHHSLQVRYLGR
jgi:phosphatidylserine decarboxylase